MIHRKLGLAALVLFAAACIPFWLRMTLIIGTGGRGYVWANRAFSVLGILTMIVSIMSFGGWLLYVTRAWGASARWVLTLLASAVLLVGEALGFLIACVGMNFVGQ